MDPAAWDAKTLAELPQRQRCEGRWTDLEVTLFGDPSFLEAKVAAGMLAELIEDYRATADDERADPSLRRSAMLLEEALQRDRRFIESHREGSPHVLFQCVWNAFVGARQGAGPVDPAEGDPLARIERLLSAWRAAKDRATPGFTWVRSLFPPTTPIGSGQIDVVRGHGNAVGPVAWSADGERLVYVVRRFSGHDLVLRDARTLEVLATYELHSDVKGLAVCPRTGRLAVVCSSGPLLLVEPGSAPVRELKVPSELDDPEGVAFSPDGSCLAVTARGGVQLWRAGSGEKASVFSPLAKFRDGLRLDVGAPVFTAGGEAVVVPVSDDGKSRLLLFDSVRCQPAGAYDLDACVRELAVLSDGDRLVCALEDHSVRVFSLSRREWVVRLGEHRDSVRGLAISKDGRRITSASSDGTALVWDADSAREVACLAGHDGDLLGVALSPSGEHVATGGMDHSLRVWDASRVWPARARPREEDRWRAVKSSRDGRWLAVVTEPSGLRVFGPGEAREPLDVPEAGCSVWCLAFAHDGESLLFADGGKGPRVLDLHTGTVRPLVVPELQGISFIEVSRDGALTAVGTKESGVHLLRASASGPPALEPIGHGGGSGAAFSADGRRLMAWGEYGADVFDLASGGKPASLYSEDDYADRSDEVRERSPSNDMLCADLSPDGSCVVTGTSQHKLERWDATTGKALPSFLAPGETMELRNSQTGEVVGRFAVRHELLTYVPFLSLRQGIRGVAFSADGTSLATFTRGLTRLWDATTQQMLKELYGQCDLRDLTSPSSAPFAFNDGYELAFLSRSTWKADAWFPESFRPMSAGPGRWAGTDGQPRLLVLEGRRGQ